MLTTAAAGLGLVLAAGWAEESFVRWRLRLIRHRVLVGGVRLSAEPFVAEAAAPETRPRPADVPNPAADRQVEGVADEGVRAALQRLGRGIVSKSRR